MLKLGLATSASPPPGRGLGQSPDQGGFARSEVPAQEQGGPAGRVGQDPRQGPAQGQGGGLVGQVEGPLWAGVHDVGYFFSTRVPRMSLMPMMPTIRPASTTGMVW